MSGLVEDSENRTFVKASEEEAAENVFNQSGAQAYDSYLPGRDDNELLSEGYTVRNYREDHILADQAEALMYRMSGLDPETDREERQKLYEEAEALIGQIYSRKLFAQESAKLEAFSESD